ncbi:MAG: 7TM-DISM domain-containing protein [Leptospiraceae bacterium]|nr:7TM-DISM domain-containing protein [Leptospiraceae bacterium]MDW8306145.1 7TM-DISM domain-containing protein [Leptospiraceae bacterium]
MMSGLGRLLVWLVIAPAMAQQAVFDFRQKQEPLYFLDGQWEIFPFAWVMPSEKRQGELIKVPSGWHDGRPDLFPTNEGFATYRIRILLPVEEKGKIYALHLPQIASAYRLYLNEEKLYELGKIAESAAQAEPQYRRFILPFRLDTEEIKLTFHVSNFAEGNVGGLWQRITLGRYEEVSKRYQKVLLKDSLTVGFLLAVGLYHLILYFYKPTHRFALSFAFFCFLIALRSAMTGERILALPGWLTFEQEIALEYLTLYLGPLLFSWYIHHLYPNDMRRPYFWAVAAVSLLFVGFLLALPTILYTRFLPIFQLFLLIAVSFLVLLLVRIIKRKRLASTGFALSFFILVGGVLYDVFSNRFHVGEYIFPIALCVFVLFQAALVAKIYMRSDSLRF